MNGKMVPRKILIYDDCSTDASIDIMKQLDSKFESVSCFYGSKNRGAGYARNYLLKKVDTKYIAFLDSDDIWYENKLSEQIKEIERLNADVCICGYDIVDDTKSVVYSRSVPKKVSYSMMHACNWIPMSMALVKADLYCAKKMPMPRKRQDYAYWLTLFRENHGLNVVGLKLKLGSYTRRKNSISSSPIKNIGANYMMYRGFLKYSVMTSLFCVFLNICVRLFRS